MQIKTSLTFNFCESECSELCLLEIATVFHCLIILFQQFHTLSELYFSFAVGKDFTVLGYVLLVSSELLD